MQPNTWGTPSAVAPQRQPHHYEFVGTGGDYIVVAIGNVLLVMLTCGLAALFGIARARRRKWLVENVRINGQPLVYQVNWAENLGHFVLNIALIVVSCGIAAPWVVVRDQTLLASQMVTVEGRPLRFDGNAVEIVGLWILSGLAIFFTLGLAWPWVAVMWARWRFAHLLIEDPSVPGGLRRLELNATGGGYLVQGLVNGLLTAITFGIYWPWATAAFERWLWSCVRDHT